MTEREALLWAILDDPECDTARVVYADWLEEHAGTVECGVCKGKRLVKRSKGGPDWYGRMGPESLPVKDCPTCSGSGRVSNGFAERAEFIRVQVELANWGGCDWKTKHVRAGYVDCDQWNDLLGEGRTMTWCPMCARRLWLRARERELWDQWGETWVRQMIPSSTISKSSSAANTRRL